MLLRFKDIEYTADGVSRTETDTLTQKEWAMYKHILFATDLTEDTEYLVEKVRTVRGYTSGTLSLIHVVEPLPGYSYAYLGIEELKAYCGSKTSHRKTVQD